MSSYIITLPDGSKNTIRADAEFVEKHYPGAQLVPEPEAVEPEPAASKRITQLAFLDRFSEAEGIAIDLASIGATVEAAGMRRWLKRVDAATFIDLADPRTVAGLQMLEVIGLIGPGRAAEILNAPIQQVEAA